MDKVALKEFLQKKYENPKAFLENVIFPVFGEDNYDDSGSYHWLRKHPEDKTAADNSGIQDILVLGSIYVEGSQLDIFDITVASKRQLANSRVGIQQLIRRIISTHSGAFMIFHYNTTERWDWRFTFCHKGASQLDSSDAKRYTFLLGPGQSCRTAAENFCKLGEKIATDGEFEMDDIIKAFDVEALSKEFFDKYKAQYVKFVEYMADEENGMRDNFIDTDFDKEGLTDEEICSREEKPLRDYVKKLLGRIVFLHFIQKKGWLGVEPGNEWGDGDMDFMMNLFEKATNSQKDNFLDEVLEPIFEQALNTDRSDKDDLFDTGIKALPNNGVLKIPYLNGGLFEREASDEPASVFPAEYFQSLLTFLSQYNFTIDENDPNDAQVGIDPEMLGRIFENLLEDNKDKGAFYTPKEIVQYMCRESLIAYLQTDKADDEKQIIRDFVSSYDITPLSEELKQDIDSKLRSVKICDPAIGSGAFPMGLLQEIFYCRGAIENFDEAAEIKKDIIQNNIYGVDIEKGAVDIARLRFWLSIIVDEKVPYCLPNMDFKIMQGNSLIEDYKGLDLSGLANGSGRKKKKGEDGTQLSFNFGTENVLENIRIQMDTYYKLSDHKKKNETREAINELVRTYIKKYTLDNPEIAEEIDALPIPNDQFFLWHTYFADVFQKGGFNIVIGNPPYGVSIKGNNRRQVVNTLGRVPDFEIYYFFVQLSKLLLNANGILSYIIPNTWLFNTFAKNFRHNVVNDWGIIEILDCSRFKLFESATVMNSIILFSTNVDLILGVGYRSTNNADSFGNLLNEPRRYMSVEQVLSMNQNWGLAFRLTPDKLSLVQKISNQPKTLSDYFDCSQGYIPYRLSDLVSTYGQVEGKRIKNERLWHSSTQSDEYWIQELYGRDINKYTYSPTGEYVKYGEHVATYVNERFFNQKRVVVREITNPCIIACIIHDTLLNDPQLLPLIKKSTNDNFGYEALWGLLNSKLATFYHFNHSPKATKGAFPKILIVDLNSFPIPDISSNTFLQFSEKCRELLHRKSSTPDLNVSELEAEIDALVYRFYDLSNNEIDIVEGVR